MDTETNPRGARTLAGPVLWLVAACVALVAVAAACETDDDTDGPERGTPSAVGADTGGAATDVGADERDTAGTSLEDVSTGESADVAGDAAQGDASGDAASSDTLPEDGGAGSGDASSEPDGSGEAEGSGEAPMERDPDTCVGVWVESGADEASQGADWVQPACFECPRDEETGLPTECGLDTCTQTPDCVECPGTAAPTWELYDFQPQSCGYGEIYGLERFRGTVTVVVLWSATCSFCQAQLSKIEELRLELSLQGIEPHIVGVSLSTTADFQERLTERGSIPLFQDTAEVNAWAMHNGDKDDMYIYAPDGTLDRFIDDGSNDINLNTETGYAFVRDAIVDAWDRYQGEGE